MNSSKQTVIQQATVLAISALLAACGGGGSADGPTAGADAPSPAPAPAPGASPAPSVPGALSPTYTGAYPNALNYGWFNYYPTDAAGTAAGVTQHMLKANPEAATLIRSSTGNSYARMHLTNIQYATATPAYTGKQTWTFEFDIQPAN